MILIIFRVTVFKTDRYIVIMQQENYHCLSTFNNYKSQHELLHVSIHQYGRKEKNKKTHNECKMK
jgi:hypothetical protein